MDFYAIAGIILFVAVAAALVAWARHYQKVREKTGYKKGQMYTLGQHTGAFAGNYQMNKLGATDGNAKDRVDTDEEMFVFSDGDKQK